MKATRGEVITYNSTYIDPVYHGSCGGKGTENAEDVWSYAIPYLRRVSCDKEYRANDQRQTIEIDKKDLAAALIAGRIGVESVSAASTPGEQIIKSLERTASGRLKEVMIYGQKVSGTDLRKVLGLSSTFMSWQNEGSKIKVTSIGKGHAVGLCQYGANGMALAGSNYKKILLHYYTGVKIEKLKY